MSSDGKQLESLVAFVEETLLPPGFEVKSNERVFNDEGVQVAEFDIEIRGKVGTTSIAWLIEPRWPLKVLHLWPLKLLHPDHRKLMC